MENNAKILSNVCIAKDIWKMELESEIAPLAKPGQFVMIQVPSFFLRRPISVSDTHGNVLTIVYKIMGQGTQVMSEMEPGQVLNLEGPLGQGFPVLEKEEVLLIGGGVGCPPLLKTAKAYLDKNIKVKAVFGFNSKDDIYYMDEFAKLGIEVHIATMDGSFGTKGTVMDAIAKNNITADYVLACGPIPMLKAVQNAYTDGYISLESRMGCGIGVCMGCVVEDNRGMLLRVCKNGPVFPIGKVVL